MPPRVAITVPVSSRPELLPEEELSLRHLCHFLGRYDRYLIVPPGSTIRRDGLTTVEVPRKFFGSVSAHNFMQLWPPFYRRFQDYDYVLMYHLDSLVFSDELPFWCDTGVDYIGAPWIPCNDTPWVTEPRVGNGGFTLIKVQSALRVLRNRHRRDPLGSAFDVLLRNRKQLGPLISGLDRARRILPNPAWVGRCMDRIREADHPDENALNCDFFWSFRATRYLPSFRVASVAQGLRFAFEAAPRLCFELNGGRLPFGCHAWARYDRTFWEPYLLPEGSGT